MPDRPFAKIIVYLLDGTDRGLSCLIADEATFLNTEAMSGVLVDMRDGIVATLLQDGSRARD